MAAMTKRLGGIGIVTDGPIREVKGIRELGFHCFASGVVAARGYYRIVDTNIRVELSGVVVQSGEIIHGDENGLVLIPPAIVDRLPDAIVAEKEREDQLSILINNPDSTTEQILNEMSR